jgi:Transposase IS66 family
MQDLAIRADVVNFRCERWETADGEIMTAPLPAGIDRHFGPQLRCFVLAQYHQAQTTVPRLVTLLRSLGLVVSKCQVVRLLIEGQDGFLTEARDVLRAGLSTATWITADDTGARHKSSICTQMGNAHFAWFGTTCSKSRLNFLDLLRAGFDNYVINAEALAYMRERALAAQVTARLTRHPDRCLCDRMAWNAHLDALGIRITALKVSPAPVLIATEGALWGGVKAHGLLPDTVIVSDNAGQFKIGSYC